MMLQLLSNSAKQQTRRKVRIPSALIVYNSNVHSALMLSIPFLFHEDFLHFRSLLDDINTRCEVISLSSDLNTI